MQNRAINILGPTGFWLALVVSVDSPKHISVRVPKLSSQTVYSGVRLSGFTPSVGDYVWVSFIEGQPESMVAFSSASVVDHGSLVGLSDDDHTQYLLADGSRDAAYIGFDIGSNVAVSEGQIAWNDDEGTVDIGMHGGNVVLQSGQEVVYYVKNQTGSTIGNGTVVRFDGALGSSGRIKAAPFLANGSYRSSYIMGIATESIANGEDGYVTHFGKVRGLNTTVDSEGNSLVDGDLLYASATVSGGLTKIEPEAPNNRILLAAVIQAHAHQGVLFVRPTFVTDLLDNERVRTTSISDNDVLVYNGTAQVFENQQFDHGGLTGLSDDDHTQYLLVDGSRSASSLTIDGNLTVDTSSLFVDSSSNRVGVNNLSPSEALDVSGNATVSGSVSAGGHYLSSFVPLNPPVRIQSGASYSVNNWLVSWLTSDSTSSGSSTLGGIVADSGCIGALVQLSVSSPGSSGFIALRDYAYADGATTPSPSWTNLNFDTGVATSGVTTFVAVTWDSVSARNKFNVWYDAASAGTTTIDVVALIFKS